MVLVYVLYYTFYSTKMAGTKDTKKSILHVRNNSNDTSDTARPIIRKDAPKAKQKILLPTLKEQQRYMVYRLLVGKNTAPIGDFASVHNDILGQCNTLLGVFDGGKAGLMGVKFNPSRMYGIIRVNSRYVDKLKVCLGLIKTVKGDKGNNIAINDVAVDCVFVSGMLNKAVDKMNDSR